MRVEAGAGGPGHWARVIRAPEVGRDGRVSPGASVGASSPSSQQRPGGSCVPPAATEHPAPVDGGLCLPALLMDCQHHRDARVSPGALGRGAQCIPQAVQVKPW